MQIVCQHCSHKFESSTPKGVILRCPSCSKPTGGGEKIQEVICENCGTHYAIPTKKFSDGKLALVCKKCDHHFEVVLNSTKAGTKADPEEADLALDEDDLDLGEADLTLDEDEGDLDLGDSELDLNDADESDLVDSSDFEEEDELFTDPLANLDEEEELNDSENLDDEESLEPVPFDLDLNDEEDDFTFEPPETDLDDDFSLSPEDQLTSVERGLFLGGDAGMPELMVELDRSDRPHKKSRAPFWAFVGVVFSAVLVAGAYLAFNHPELLNEYVELPPALHQPRQAIQLTLVEPLKGRWIENSLAGRFFVLEGQVKSFYTEGTKLEQVQLGGRLYGEGDRLLAQSTNLASRRLSTRQLSGWSLEKLEAFTSLKPGDKGPELDPNKPMWFQILFLSPKGSITKLEAQIDAFVVDGQPVQVE
ncbi:MAG: hypothetical protein A2516_02015 [Alphaproteobacteria bacterium RIFOXYD12_FULL_60_8]|nr:MAG: hypothetical protein A2516_02015 [Alphaproteobacteria bacterium RIFOXYD12_FULL_60_8]